MPAIGRHDIALSPDNVDISSDAIMIQEDGTSSSRPVFATNGREAGIWRLDLVAGVVDVASATLVAVLAPPGRDGVPIPTPGTGETSGIIDTAGVFGDDTWIFDVQAHAPTTAPAAQTVEDGQLLMLVPAAPGPVRRRGTNSSKFAHAADPDPPPQAAGPSACSA